jgi:hypothetical protein
MTEYETLKAKRDLLLKERESNRQRFAQVENELHNVRMQMKASRLRQIALDSRCDLRDPNQLIQAAHLLLRRLAMEDVEFAPDEQAVLDALQEWGNRLNSRKGK